jgi:hypothetical protein
LLPLNLDSADYADFADSTTILLMEWLIKNGRKQDGWQDVPLPQCKFTENMMTKRVFHTNRRVEQAFSLSPGFPARRKLI